MTGDFSFAPGWARSMVLILRNLHSTKVITIEEYNKLLNYKIDIFNHALGIEDVL